jgi:hypothetical protein
MKLGERRGNAGPWKTRKTKTRFPFLFPRPWKSLRDSHIPTAPATVPFFFRKRTRKKPRKGARHRDCLISSLQAHSWIRKCCSKSPNRNVRGVGTAGNIVLQAGFPEFSIDAGPADFQLLISRVHRLRARLLHCGVGRRIVSDASMTMCSVCLQTPRLHPWQVRWLET